MPRFADAAIGRKAGRSASADDAGLYAERIPGSTTPNNDSGTSTVLNRLLLKQNINNNKLTGFRLVWFLAMTSIAFLFLQQSHVAKSSLDSLLTTESLISASSLSMGSSSSLLRAGAGGAGYGYGATTAALLFQHQGRATALPPLEDEVVEQEEVPSESSDNMVTTSMHSQTRIFELFRRDWGVQSLLSVGSYSCGHADDGGSSLWLASTTLLWFQMQGVSTTCVDPKMPAVNRHSTTDALKESSSILLLGSSNSGTTTTTLVNHDFTRGPWWPDETTDLVWWSITSRQQHQRYMPNYFAAMAKAAVVLTSFPFDNSKKEKWWILQFELRGFRYHEGLTQQVGNALLDNTGVAVAVFINPTVASLSVHAHLFPADLYDNAVEKTSTALSTLPSSSSLLAAPPSKIDVTMHEKWVQIVKEWHAKTKTKKEVEDHATVISTPTTGTAKKSFTRTGSSIRSQQKLVKDMHAKKEKGDGGGDETRTKAAAGAVSTQQAANNSIMSHHAVTHIPDHIAKGNLSRSSFPKIPVVVWPLWEFGEGTAEALHIEKNGIDESPFLQLSNDVYDFDPNVVWIGDTGYAYGWSFWCTKFNEQVLAAKERRIQLGLPTSWPIYIVDWTDGVTKQRCPQVEQAVGRDFVKYSQRSIVTKRRWNDEKGWVNEGNMTNLVEGGIKYHHTPLIVRTDIIQNLQRALHERGLKLRDGIETLDRPVDVTHAWPLNPSDPSSKVGDVQSKLRTKVSRIIFDMANTTEGGDRVNVFVDRVGNAAREGRRGVASAYVDAMLRTKILVVTQRDSWEDHYRLFEGLISGAMVMTDHMISLPAGLNNGTSIIEFSSEDQLRSLITYYVKNSQERLAIAREGRRVSMMRHRTWHRIEEVIFGRALTVCSDSPTATTGCPYILHANETSRRR